MEQHVTEASILVTQVCITLLQLESPGWFVAKALGQNTLLLTHQYLLLLERQYSALLGQ